MVKEQGSGEGVSASGSYPKTTKRTPTAGKRGGRQSEGRREGSHHSELEKCGKEKDENSGEGRKRPEDRRTRI